MYYLHLFSFHPVGVYKHNYTIDLIASLSITKYMLYVPFNHQIYTHLFLIYHIVYKANAMHVASVYIT